MRSGADSSVGLRQGYLERANVNLDDCVLRVLGKGHKERLVPFSVEARKHLFRWMRQSGSVKLR